jgi:hypothetical protein
MRILAEVVVAEIADVVEVGVEEGYMRGDQIRRGCDAKNCI